MTEAQTLIWMNGPLASMTKRLVSNCGVSRMRFRRRTWVQTNRSTDLPDQHRQAVDDLLTEIPERLKPFRDFETHVVSLRAMVRHRWIDDAEEPLSYTAFWGQFSHPEHLDAAFGSLNPSKIVFRRGVWEEWSTDHPEFEPNNQEHLIFSPYCGTLLHEAVGHAMEDEYLSSSPLNLVQGSRVSHEELTVADCPDLDKLPGSMLVDDCGVAASRTTLIHRGILVGDLAQGRGIWRRGDYRDCPMVRASNFVVREGTSNPQDWLDLPSTYITSITRGQWIPGSQSIKLLCGPSFQLKEGRPVGYRPWLVLELESLDVLQRVVGIGTDCTVDPHVHWCVKKKQAVPISLTSPSIMVGPT